MVQAKRLTETGIERLQPAKERVEHPDAIVPGLRLIVQPSGRKSWALRTRIHDRTTKLTLGAYPILSLADARVAAREALLAAGRGADPRETKRAIQTDTVAAVVAEWLKRDQSNNRTLGEVTRLLAKDVLPAWRHRTIASITKRDVLKVIDAAVDRGAATVALRLHARMRRLFTWAVGRGIVAASPMNGLEPPGAEVRRDRVLNDLELAAVWQAAASLGYPFGPIVQLLALTGARRDEIASLTWDEVDETNAAIHLAGSRTKNGEAHNIPLSPTALSIVAKLARVETATGSMRFVFTTTGRSPPVGWSKAKARLDRVVEIPPWRFHDLRRTAASGMARLGVAVHVVERLLNHRSGTISGVAAVYNRFDYWKERVAAAKVWERELLRIAEGHAGGNVVAFKS